MRKLIALLCLIFVSVPLLAFGADSVVQAQDLLPPDSIVSILNVLEALPYVGPVLVAILKWIAIIAPIATALSFCVQAILAVPEIAARFSGAHDLADKIKAWSDKINYYISLLSIRNAQKPQ